MGDYNDKKDDQPTMELKGGMFRVSSIILPVVLYLRQTDLYCLYGGGTGGELRTNAVTIILKLATDLPK